LVWLAVAVAEDRRYCCGRHLLTLLLLCRLRLLPLLLQRVPRQLRFRALRWEVLL
jgi:hypothetical protein